MRNLQGGEARATVSWTRVIHPVPWQAPGGVWEGKSIYLGSPGERPSPLPSYRLTSPAYVIKH